jgi:ribulose-5-phosphate 4-epimerase/fuculose-1-phosphate aldolase
MLWESYSSVNDPLPKATSNHMSSSSAIEQAKWDVMASNHILARELVLDGYGHVSMRNPENPNTFFLSRSRSPELVSVDDIMEFTLDGNVVGNDDRPAYLERFIHGSIFAARPDIVSVVHSHQEDVIPYSISSVPLVPVWHQACSMGSHVPVWDIHDKFGDTNLLVTSVEQGADLAQTLGRDKVTLMRGHGFVAAGGHIQEAVSMAIYLPKNARIFTTAKLLGGTVKPVTPGEAGKAGVVRPEQPAFQRGWEYWLKRAGVAK